MTSSPTETQLPRMEILFAQIIEKLFKTAKHLDRYQGALLHNFDGKVFELQFLPVKFPVYLTVNFNQLSTQSHLNGQADAIISASIHHWSQLNPVVEFPDPKTTVDFDNFQIQGDEVLGEQFLQALHNLEIDWEEHLSHLTGDLIAYQLGSGVRRWRNYKKQLGTQALQTLEEYLKYEIELTPSRTEVKNWQLQLERLASEMNAIERRFNKAFPDKDLE